jgi:hypothetical protein
MQATGDEHDTSPAPPVNPFPPVHWTFHAEPFQRSKAGSLE